MGRGVEQAGASQLATVTAMDYHVDLVERAQPHDIRHLQMHQSPLGYHWQENGADLEEIEPRPTIMQARRALERAYLYTHEIVWPVAIPRGAPGRDRADYAVSIHLPRPLLWELRLLAGLHGKPVGGMIRDLIQHYLRPGTLPTLDDAFINQLLEERAAKLQK